jgi:hypothetical protein
MPTSANLSSLNSLLVVPRSIGALVLLEREQHDQALDAGAQLRGTLLLISGLCSPIVAWTQAVTDLRSLLPARLQIQNVTNGVWTYNFNALQGYWCELFVVFFGEMSCCWICSRARMEFVQRQIKSSSANSKRSIVWEEAFDLGFALQPGKFALLSHCFLSSSFIAHALVLPCRYGGERVD